MEGLINNPNFMVIEKILKELTPERIKKEVEKIKNTKLPKELRGWVDEYEKVGKRDEFIWKWLYKMFQGVQLPIVPQQYKKSLLNVKILMTMFIVQLDDIADKKQNEKFLNELLKIPFNKKNIKAEKFNKKEKLYLKFTIKIWNELEKQIKKYPEYKKINKILHYDINQVFNAINYSYLVNRNLYMINKIEYWEHLSYNMVLFVYSDFDLMCCSGFDIQQLGITREFIWLAQKMARIGNWVSTWKREIDENDFSSGIFSYAIDLRIINVKDLKKKNKSRLIHQIKKAKLEQKLLEEWELCYDEIKKLSDRIKLIKPKTFLSSLEKLIILHLTSEGYK